MNYNEKLFLKKLESIYDALYEKADKLIKKYNPCQVQITNSGKKSCVSCIASRNKEREGNWTIKGQENQLCCSGCKFLGPNGCQAEKTLTCKLWLCSSKFGVINEKLKKLEKLAEEYYFLVFRGDKKIH